MNQHELAMKQQLRNGTYADLNVYILPRIDYFKGMILPARLMVMGGDYDFPHMVTPQSED